MSKIGKAIMKLVPARKAYYDASAPRGQKSLSPTKRKQMARQKAFEKKMRTGWRP